MYPIVPNFIWFFQSNMIMHCNLNSNSTSTLTSIYNYKFQRKMVVNLNYFRLLIALVWFIGSCIAEYTPRSQYQSEIIPIQSSLVVSLIPIESETNQITAYSPGILSLLSSPGFTSSSSNSSSLTSSVYYLPTFTSSIYSSFSFTSSSISSTSITSSFTASTGPTQTSSLISSTRTIIETPIPLPA